MMSFGAFSSPEYYCGGVIALQTKLEAAGFPVGGIDGDPGPATWNAIQAFAANSGLPVPPKPIDYSKAPVPLTPAFCNALNGGTSQPAVQKMRNPGFISPVATRVIDRVNLQTRADQGYVTDEIATTPPPPADGWWASQTSTTKTAIVGGGVVAAVAIAYFATKR